MRAGNLPQSKRTVIVIHFRHDLPAGPFLSVTLTVFFSSATVNKAGTTATTQRCNDK